MPEGLEAEIYRRSVERCVGRTIASVDVDERQPQAPQFPASLIGRQVAGVRRHGKLVLIDFAPFAEHAVDSVGLHFGMTGRVVVDGLAPISELEYGSGRDDPTWDRLTVGFECGGVLRVNDPRRWATFTLEPDLSKLGPDFLSVDPEQLVGLFRRRRAAIKTVLLNQGVIAGYGNLCVDEVLWQLDVSPHTPACDLTPATVSGFAVPARRILRRMLRAGGSHRGVLEPSVRAAVPPCPRGCGPLCREQVGGRTTLWCPSHQVVT